MHKQRAFFSRAVNEFDQVIAKFALFVEKQLSVVVLPVEGKVLDLLRYEIVWTLLTCTVGYVRNLVMCYEKLVASHKL